MCFLIVCKIKVVWAENSVDPTGKQLLIHIRGAEASALHNSPTQQLQLLSAQAQQGWEGTEGTWPWAKCFKATWSSPNRRGRPSWEKEDAQGAFRESLHSTWRGSRERFTCWGDEGRAEHELGLLCLSLLWCQLCTFLSALNSPQKVKTLQELQPGVVRTCESRIFLTSCDRQCTSTLIWRGLIKDIQFLSRDVPISFHPSRDLNNPWGHWATPGMDPDCKYTCKPQLGCYCTGVTFSIHIAATDLINRIAYIVLYKLKCIPKWGNAK